MNDTLPRKSRGTLAVAGQRGDGGGWPVLDMVEDSVLSLGHHYDGTRKIVTLFIYIPSVNLVVCKYIRISSAASPSTSIRLTNHKELSATRLRTYLSMVHPSIIPTDTVAVWWI